MKFLLFAVVSFCLFLNFVELKAGENQMSNLNSYINNAENSFSEISPERKEKLNELADYITKKQNSEDIINLNFICTHNSRRSHMSQIWAQTAANLYKVGNLKCYSGGTEATAFNPRAVKALRKAGFEINIAKEGDNPVYNVKYAENKSLKAFSKVYDDEYNPENFVAVMTCSDADENCPYIPGAEARFAITYDDPKEFDGTELEEQKYDERCRQIATEMFYVFSQVES